jgi:predicted lipid-binding transport protein (Tim44 family)
MTVFPWGKKRKEQVEQLAADMDAASAAEDKVLDTVASEMANRPTAEAPGVDVSAITKADPTFNEQDFLTIARDTLYHVREARTADRESLDDALLSPQLEKELDDVIAGDVTAHRHHLLPGLEIRTIVITAAAVTDGKLAITVRLHLSSEEEERDDAGKLTAGSEQIHEWDDDWTFWRDPTVDSSATDKQRTEMFEREGGWFIAHKGWIVTSIQRANVDATAA